MIEDDFDKVPMEIKPPVVTTARECRCGSDVFKPSAKDAVYCATCGAFYVVGSTVILPVAEIVFP